MFAAMPTAAPATAAPTSAPALLPFHPDSLDFDWVLLAIVTSSSTAPATRDRRTMFLSFRAVARAPKAVRPIARSAVGGWCPQRVEPQLFSIESSRGIWKQGRDGLLRRLAAGVVAMVYELW